MTKKQLSKYVKECKSFKFLQENWQPKVGDKCLYDGEIFQIKTFGEEEFYIENEKLKSTYFKKENCVFLPSLSQCIEGIGNKFFKLRKEGITWVCDIYSDGVYYIKFIGANFPELACLKAWKEVESEKT